MVLVEQKTVRPDKFYQRMAGTLYKRSIPPPFIIVKSRSINKNDRRRLIASDRIDYKGKTESEIRVFLKNQSS